MIIANVVTIHIGVHIHACIVIFSNDFLPGSVWLIYSSNTATILRTILGYHVLTYCDREISLIEIKERSWMRTDSGLMEVLGLEMYLLRQNNPVFIDMNVIWMLS